MEQRGDSDRSPSPGPLSGGDTQVAVQVADAASASVPLAMGLRALAEETSSRRLAGRLRRLSERLEAGVPVDQALSDQRDGLPPYVSGIIRAATCCGDTGVALVELLDHQRSLREMWRSIRAELSYALILLALSLLLGVWTVLALIGPLAGLFEESQMELPPVTQVLVWIYQVGIWLVLGTLASVLVGGLLYRLLAGAARWRRLLGALPLLGALWKWSGVAESSWLLAVLTERQMPLPEALRLAAGGVSDANVREICDELATGVEEGKQISDLVEQTRCLPVTLVPVLRWGERNNALPEAFRIAGDMFCERVLARADLVNAVVPPIVFIGVATFALTLIIGLYSPMFSLIQGLS